MNNYIKLNKNKEKGQIIVLLAVSLVVVVIVAALAVDGGMIYSERRYAQNAADAASLAGGGKILHSGFDDPGTEFSCPANSSYSSISKKFTRSGNIIAMSYLAAKDSASTNNVNDLPYLGYIRNGVFVDEGVGHDINENHGVVIECNSTTDPYYIDTTVRITSQVSTAFAHLIYPDNLITTNEAITRVQTSQNIGYGNAIISLSETCQNTEDGGTYFAGSSIIKIKGGGTHSNSCLVGNGTASLQVIIDDDQNLNLHYDDADLNPAGAFEYNGGQEVLNIGYPDEPDCSDLEEKTALKFTNKDTTETIPSGIYPGIEITGIADGHQVVFEPGGLFCMTGDLSITGGDVFGNGVTFFMQQDLSNPKNPKDTNVKITADATVKLAAPYNNVSDTFGILFFMDIENEGIIKLVGTNDSYFSGLVYAPSGFIDIGGTSTTGTFTDDRCALINGVEGTCQAATFSTQFIGWSVRVKGDGNLDILFDDTGLPRTDTNMFLKD